MIMKEGQTDGKEEREKKERAHLVAKKLTSKFFSDNFVHLDGKSRKKM